MLKLISVLLDVLGLISSPVSRIRPAIKKIKLDLKQGRSAMISIIMPSYNSAEFIEQAIASVRSQTFPHFELLVCDDGSTDATIEIVERLMRQDDRIKLLKNNCPQHQPELQHWSAAGGISLDRPPGRRRCDAADPARSSDEGGRAGSVGRVSGAATPDWSTEGGKRFVFCRTDRLRWRSSRRRACPASSS